MKLWYASASPFVRKTMVVAHETGQIDKIELVNVATTPIATDEKLLGINPARKIPAMQLEGGMVLMDSRVICAYLNEQGGGALLPSDERMRYASMTLEAVADALMDAAVLTRYETFLRPEQFRWQDWVDGQLGKVDSILDNLENHWVFVLEGPLSIGVIGIGCALGYLDFRFPDRDWRVDHPKLAEWFAGFSERDSMKATMPA